MIFKCHLINNYPLSPKIIIFSNTFFLVAIFTITLWAEKEMHDEGK
jgi:hypothetical protein